MTAPAFKQPRGLVHFLGGAFAGAAPQLAYQYLIKWIADAGYTVVATPYAVTFRHLDCAARVQQVPFLSAPSRFPWACINVSNRWTTNAREVPLGSISHAQQLPIQR